MGVKYIAVCASHNEEEFIAQSISSVLSQTIQPEICLLSDDGSTDETLLIAERFDIPIIISKRPRYKLRGINQVLALNHGIMKASEMIPCWDFLLKFDADVVIPNNYVEHLLSRMNRHPTLGICAGKPEGENIRFTRASDGAKLYRRTCWDDIGGLDVWIAFDSHAILKAYQSGWVVRTLPSVTFKELRPSGKYGLTRWVLTGFERASFGFPLHHTIMASIKNIRRGSPPILNVFTTIFSHMINPWSKAPNLNQEWIREYAKNEVRLFMWILMKGYSLK